MNGKSLLANARKNFRVANNAQLAKVLGVSGEYLRQVERVRVISERRIVTLLKKMASRTKTALGAKGVQPLLEYYPITSTDAGSKKEIVDRRGHNGAQVRKLLDGHRGIYVFYDSTGRAVYVGKTTKRSLWKRMNESFNSGRGIKKAQVDHPSRRTTVEPAYVSRRDIRDRPVKVRDVAHFFSAYAVDDSLISSIEAFATRAFANDVKNIRVERFPKE